ncbi:MAG: DUF4442 domain-containing protein [Nitriliruptor sp.]|nr:MAG: DUF4442 domain-containing protein [Nitriliruptor sp.]
MTSEAATADQPVADPTRELLAGLRSLGDGLPFNRHLGATVRVLEIGHAETVLAPSGDLDNHLGGVHAVAELAPVELAGALAATSRLTPLLERGYVPVVGELAARYLAPARGELRARASLGPEAVGPAQAALEEGHRPRVAVEVEVVDADDEVVLTATLTFVFIAADAGAAGGDG